MPANNLIDWEKSKGKLQLSQERNTFATLFWIQHVSVYLLFSQVEIHIHQLGQYKVSLVEGMGQF